jgi:hypothetical protein
MEERRSAPSDRQKLVGEVEISTAGRRGARQAGFLRRLPAPIKN